MSGTAVVLVPYDAGIESWRMGAGPDALFDETFRRSFDQDYPSSRMTHLHPETNWRTELKTTFDLHHRIAAHVRTAASDGLPPLIVAGDCTATVGVIGEAERQELLESGVRVVSIGAPRDELEMGIAAWASDIDRIHVHIDADVVDDSYGRANDWASSGGMSPDDVRRIIRYAASVRLLASAVLASQDPRADRSGALHEPMRDIALTLAEELRRSAARTASSG